MQIPGKTLYWKISATILLLVVVMGAAYLFITSYTAGRYLEEIHQRLYGGIADSMVQVVKPRIEDKVDTMAVQDIMHSMMVINPSVEVYLLDTAGGIITYVAPNKTIEVKRIDLAPVQRFIRARGDLFIKGDDPRNPGQHKVFSAAPILDGERLTGYVYIILASEEQSVVVSTLSGSYTLRLGAQLFFLALAVGLILGLLAIWYLTQNLRDIIEKVRRFKEGDMQTRMETGNKGEFGLVGQTFNEMADTIEKNIRELQSVENLRRELIANVSHDLRTPLAIMQGYVETLLMKEEALSAEERKKYLEVVYGSSENLSGLIAQLFEYSKLEARQIEPQKEPFRIEELAQDIFQQYEILARQKDIRLELNLSAKLPLIFADLGLVARVFQNLIDNALQFTPPGGIIRLIIEESPAGVLVKVADTGPGIPENEQAHIFERFRRASSSGKKEKGAGLGLAIVKKILELHHSTIRVQSRLNEGTTFWFQLPSYILPRDDNYPAHLI
jgi:signal transduction histidine kinase